MAVRVRDRAGVLKHLQGSGAGVPPVSSAGVPPAIPFSITKSARDFTSVMIETAKRWYRRDPSKPAFTDDGEFRRRLDTCRACEHGNQKAQRCKLCRCPFTKIATFAAKKCPAGKW